MTNILIGSPAPGGLIISFIIISCWDTLHSLASRNYFIIFNICFLKLASSFDYIFKCHHISSSLHIVIGHNSWKIENIEGNSKIRDLFVKWACNIMTNTLVSEHICVW